MSLLTDIEDEERKAAIGQAGECALCILIAEQTTEKAMNLMRDAASGKLSLRALTRVLAKNNTGIGRRTVERHRREGHK